MVDQSQELPRGYIRARPIRVAFLIADGEHSHLILDSIFAESFSRWGGRYSLICPCENGYPRAAYLPWLRALDPDIVYSFVDLTEENLRRMHEELGPAYLVRHRESFRGAPTAYDFRVALPIRPLTSLSTALQYTLAFPTSSPQPIRVVDYLPGQAHDRFIDDNFGTYYGSSGSWPIPVNLADAVKPLAVAAEQLLAAPNRGRRYEGETVPDAMALLQFMTANRNTFGLAQLAGDAAPRIDLRDNYEDAFTFVVGDTFADRIVFWNLRSRDPVSLGREPCSLISSPSRLDDPDFFAAVSEFLRKRNGVPRSVPMVKLCSTSLAQDELIRIQERFQAADTWNMYSVAQQLTLDSIVPSATVFGNARYLVTGGLLDKSPEWKEFSAAGKEASPPLVVPKHLAHVQTRSLATSGSWALDVTIERQENHSRYSNIRHTWFFPRRLRFHRAFLDFYESTHEGREYRHTRASAQGSLSLFAGLGEDLPPITLPSDETAARYAIQRGDTWPPFRSADRWGTPRGPFAWARPSDKGRYLIGALRMFDGFQNAGAILLHSYWRSIFEELGGAVGSVRRERIKESIKKKVRTVTTQPADWDEATWERLTALVASEAHQVRLPQGSLSYDELSERHRPYLAREEAILSEHKEDDGDKWIERSKRSLRQGVQDRCARNVLFQGHQWRCDTCFSTNWNDIAALSSELTCSICGAKEPAPVDEPWSFRLNEFLQDAMREHGLLALVWCLVELERRARETFFYLGPHDLWKEYPKAEGVSHDNEADLICVVDSRVHLCEVKSSARDIVLTSLVEVARRLRPDIVTLAVMEEPSRRLTAKVEELRLALADPGIEVELLTLQHDAQWDDAYLP